jgi:hypothetical protein
MRSPVVPELALRSALVAELRLAARAAEQRSDGVAPLSPAVRAAESPSDPVAVLSQEARVVRPRSAVR